MRIELVTPAPRGSRSGNRVTAVRWAGLLRDLGHRVRVGSGPEPRGWRNGPDLLIALHARRSFTAMSHFRAAWPERPLILALTGTDLYRDIRASARARRALEWADRLVLLQAAGFAELEPRLRRKARVIHQSATPPPSVRRSTRTFDICVLGHLRPVKDPFRAALAVRSLPASSRIRVLHAGGAMAERMRDRARREASRNSRWIWLGDRPRWQVRRLLGRSRVMVLPSVLEGGANVLSEALVAHLPVLASRIPGSIGLLGEDHPGLFAVRSTGELTALMERCELDPTFLERLERRSRRLAGAFRPEREAAAWKTLLGEFTGS